MNEREALERAIALQDRPDAAPEGWQPSAVELAKRLGIRPQAVYQWISKGRTPTERVLAVSAATGGKVKPHELRPDIYPAPEPAAA